MITFQVENLTQHMGEIAQLLRDHWTEIAGYKDVIPLDPDWQKYRDLDKAGILRFTTVRNGGVMIGYSLFMVIPMLHYKQNTVAANDIIFIKPEYRKGLTGYKLLKFCHEALRAEGVHRITWHVKPELDWTKLLIRMGYKIEEYTVGICLI